MNEASRAQASEIRKRALRVASDLAAAREMPEAARGLAAGTFDLVDCVRAHCLFHDPATGLVWSEPPDERECTTADGLVGMAIRTGRTIATPRAETHPAYSPATDDPRGTGAERIVVQPVIGPDAQVHAVLVAIRDSRQRAFGGEAIAALEMLASCVAPILLHVGRVVESEESRDAGAPVFRVEALEEEAAGVRLGDVIRIMPSWITPVSWLIVSFAAVIVLFLALGSVHHYSAGVGVVRAGDRSAVLVNDGGMIAALLVQPGDTVVAGQVLARLDDSDLRAQIDSLDLRLNAELRNRMRAPSDERSVTSVLALRAELEATTARLDKRAIVAPHDGTIIDIRALVGQVVAMSDVLLTMSKPDAPMELIGLLPGDDLPQLVPGMQIRFELPGYRHEHEWFELSEVGDSVIGPKQAARQLGHEVGDVLTPTGPTVLVRAVIPDPRFTADGTTFRYHDGMHGTVEVRLRREPVITTLLPGLREVFQ